MIDEISVVKKLKTPTAYNNLLVCVRHTRQKQIGLIILPDSKYVNSRMSWVIAAGRIKHKSGNVTENELKTGDRFLSYAYDYGFQVKAPEDFEVEVAADTVIYEDLLPEGVSFTSSRLIVKAGTPLELIDREVISAQLTEGMVIDDQNI